MALVSYGSSSESEASEDDDDQQVVVQPAQKGKVNENITKLTKPADTDRGSAVSDLRRPVDDDATAPSDEQPDDDATNSSNFDISDEEDDVGVSFDQRSVSGLRLPPPKVNTAANDQSTTDAPQTTVNDHTATLHTALTSGLPAPKHHSAKTTVTADDELEDLVKPKTYGEKIDEKPKKRQRTTIRISLPDASLDDSDEEDDLLAKKKMKQGPTKPGLFGLLPPPVNATVKETNRPLVPHTLTKKPSKPPPKPTVIKPTPAAKPKPQTTTHHSDDDDDEDVNFFSLGDTPTAPPSDQSLSSRSTTDISVQPARVSDTRNTASVVRADWNKQGDGIIGQGDQSVSQPQSQTDESLSQVGDSVSQADDSVSQADEPLSQADEPLQFRSDHPSVTAGGWQHHVPTQQTHSTWSAVSEEPGPQQETSTPGASFDLETLTHDEQFLRIQGKRGRGREEITFRDVSADDQMNLAALEMTKTLSEEGPAPSKKNKDGGGPTSQQKRKHQITYLAHKAKEREFDLKNQWALNRATRAQTQSKYGF